MALPENLTSSYLRYKQDTNIVATWLSNNATVCGYLYSPNPSTYNNSGSRPSPSTSIRLPTRELLTQASLIVSTTKPHILVPLSIQAILQRAIQARQRCANWFGKATKDGEPLTTTANEQHVHFIGVLRRVVEILGVRFEKPVEAKGKVDGKSKSANADKPNSSNPTNQFSPLTLSEIDGLLPTTPPHPTTKTNKSRSKPKPQPTLYEVETTALEDREFNTFCFFEDLQNLNTFLSSSWSLYHSGSIDLHTVSLVTNVTCELVRKVESELVSQYPEMRIPSGTYVGIARTVFPPEFSSPAADTAPFNDSRRKTESELAQMTYITIWSTVEKHIKYLEAPRDELLYTLRLQDTLTADEILWYDEAFPEWKCEDALLSKLIHEVYYKSCYEFEVTSSFKESSLTPPDGMKHLDPAKLALFEDQFFKSLRCAGPEQCGGRALSISDVFSIRALVDVHGVLGDKIGAAYRAMLSKAANIEEDLGIHFDIGYNTLSTPKLPKEALLTFRRPEIYRQAYNLAVFVQAVIKIAPLVRYKIRRMQDQKDLWKDYFLNGKHHPERMYASHDPAYFYKSNPLHCGMASLGIALKMQTVGMDYANTWFALGSVAHLYNAIKQTGLMQGKWKTLELVIETYKRELFKGELPTTPHQIWSRFILSVNVSITNFARDARNKAFNSRGDKDGISIHIPTGASVIFTPSRTSIYTQEYLNGEATAERFLFNIYRSSTKGRSSNKAVPTQLELLEALRGVATKEMPKLDIRWMYLSKQCEKLLQLIRTTIEATLDVSVEQSYDNRGSYILLAAHILHRTFNNICDCRECKPEKKEKQAACQNTTQTNAGGSLWLRVAADVMRNFLNEANSESLVKPYDILAIIKRINELEPAGTW